jgi:hypothetical protein
MGSNSLVDKALPCFENELLPGGTAVAITAAVEAGIWFM